MALLEDWPDVREFPRLAAGARIRYREVSLRRAEREYLGGIAENVSLGGMFIGTRHPLSVGSVISLEFEVPSEEGSWRRVRAKAVVCWRNRWCRPRGMGIRFIEFEGLGQERLEEWVGRLFAAGSGERHPAGV